MKSINKTSSIIHLHKTKKMIFDLLESIERNKNPKLFLQRARIIKAVLGLIKNNEIEKLDQVIAEIKK